MDSPDRRKSGAEMRAVEMSDQATLTSRERITLIKRELRDALDTIGMLLRAEKFEDRYKFESQVDQSVGMALFSCEAQGEVAFNDNEKYYINRLNDARRVKEIGVLVSSVAHLLTALEAREEPVLSRVEWDYGKVDTRLDRMRQDKLFLSQFVASLEDIIKNPNVDNMLNAHSLVSAYLRLKEKSEVIDDLNKDILGDCKAFEIYMAGRFFVAVEGKEEIDTSVLFSLCSDAKQRLAILHLKEEKKN